jgi:hypothetical protein
MKRRIFVGLLLAVAGFLTIYLAVALSFAAFHRDHVLLLVGLGVILILLGVKGISPLGAWGD